jgi:hypothetical protein
MEHESVIRVVFRVGFREGRFQTAFCRDIKKMEKPLVQLDNLCYARSMNTGLHSNNISGWIDRRGLDGSRGDPRR